jgi:WD and tetratricopeptide repeat-containing protein 1
MPQSNDGLVATGAGDGKVKLHLVERAGSSEVGEPSFLQCTCHAGRVKRLAIAPDLPYMLWSGAEDGTVM